MDNFIVPPIEEEKPLPSPKEASEQAFYAAAASKGNPIEDYMKIKMDLESTGDSEFIHNVKTQWDQEANAGNKQAIEDIIGDPSFDRETKKAVLRSYSLNGFIPTSLKERYIQKTASSDELNDTVHQKKAQDWVVSNLQNRRAQMDIEKREHDINGNISMLQSALGGVEHLYSGVGNTLGLVSDEEYKKGHEEYKKLAAANPISAGVGQAVGLIGGALPAAFLGGPFAALLGTSAVGGMLAGTSKFAELGQESVTEEDRLKASLANAGMTSANFAIPIFKTASLLKAMILNGSGSVALGELDITIQNRILEAYPELRQAQIDPKNMTVNAVFGALIGAAFGRKATPTQFKSKIGEESEQAKKARRPQEEFKPRQHTPETFDGESTRVTEEPLLLTGPERQIPPGSPADVTAVANPKVAETLGTAALKEDSGVIAEAMGTDKGSIVNDWVLPKVVSDEIVTANPDLSKKIQELDDSMKEIFEDMRYDPNIVDATKRETDAGVIYEAIKEIKGLHYQQSNSVTNFTDFVSEGKMVFGPNPTSGFLSLSDAQESLRILQGHIQRLPEEERGVAGIAQRKDGSFAVTWNWKKEYDDAAIRTFGPDSIQTSILGIKADALARSSLGNWLFHAGRFPDAVERGAMRAIERGTRVEDAFIKAFDKHVAGTKHGRELNHLINEAEGLGKETFSKGEIGSYFPHLSKREVDDLFESHTYWRRMQHYFYAFMNREYRHRLVSDGHQGVYNKDGDYLGPATKATPSDYKDIKEVWSFYHNEPVAFDLKSIEQNATDIVRLGNKVESDGKIYEFGILEGDIKLDMLPTEVLPRVPGYSPRIVKENFFVDVIPNKVTVNGIEIKDPIKLRNYAKTAAAAKTEREARALMEQAQANNPDATVSVRPDRTNTFGRVVTDYQVHTELFRQSKKRGERVPSSMGEARIEDRLVTSIKMAQTLSRLGAFREWENTFRAAFTKSFSNFLTNGEFPQYKTDIKPLRNMSKEDNVNFQTAHRLFEFYSKQKTYETLGDHLWKTNLHHIADILEKWRIPAESLRRLGDKGNVPVKYAKMAATAAYIHLNPIRQWVIQPAQLMEMYAINPHTAAPMFKEMLAIRMALTAETNMQVKGLSDTFVKMARQSSSLSPEEFNETLKAIQDSGLLQSIDLNVLVHGMFKEVDRNLVETSMEKALKDVQNIALSAPRISRAVGFDAAELTNRVGLYLQAKEMWKQQNPGKKWNTKENKEIIAAEAKRLAGVMDKSGNLPYQEGALSVFFQFAAISQKLLMNLIQDNATMMTPFQRARLAAVRSVLYGAKYGLPAAPLIYHFIEKSDDPEIKENAELIKRGLVDYAANNVIAAMVDPDTPSDIAFSKSLTPYSENFLPYFDFAVETVKLLDDKPTSIPRYPAISLASSFGKAVDQMQGWFITREITEQSFSEAALEAAELASGFNNYSQGVLLLGMRDKVTTNGNKLGHQYSLAEAYGKMFLGTQSQKEIDTYEILSIMGDKNKGKKEMAQDIHKGLMNIRSKIGEQESEVYYRRLSSFMSLLSERHFNAEDRADVIEQVLALDRKSYTTLKQSILADVWKHHSGKQTEENTRMMDILKRSKDPKTQEFIKLIEEGKL